MMMKCLDLCQLIAQQPQCFLLLALKPLLGRCKIRARLAYAGGVFAGVYPWNCERHAGVEFTYCFRSIVVALAFYHQRRVGNPRALGELKIRLGAIDFRTRDLHFGSLRERDHLQSAPGEPRLTYCRCPWSTERCERVMIHERV